MMGWSDAELVERMERWRKEDQEAIRQRRAAVVRAVLRLIRRPRKAPHSDEKEARR